jgi:two-component system, LytTR family, response regulator
MRVYMVDDEPLALDRVARLLEATGRVEIAGSATDPVEALEDLRRQTVDLLFLDIHMPGLSGFELLAELPAQPMIVFTTAYDRYAVDAFKVNSIDYLLKPIEPEHLERTLDKAERLSHRVAPAVVMRELLANINTAIGLAKSPWLDRIASRSGGKLEPIAVGRVSHFYSKDKLTFAVTLDRTYVVDLTVAELEQKLDPQRFIRIHRGAIVNLDCLLDVHALFGGRMVARLNDAKKTELPVSRDRAGALRRRFGLG